MIFISPSAEATKNANARAEPSLSAGATECVYCIFIPAIIAGWVIFIIYVLVPPFNKEYDDDDDDDLINNTT